MNYKIIMGGEVVLRPRKKAMAMKKHPVNPLLTSTFGYFYS